MTRTLFIRVLLSLLLLVSQQMSMSHAVTHLAGSAQARDNEVDGGLSKAVADHQSCEKCLAFAQLAGAVGTLPRAFAGIESAASDVAGAVRQPAAAASIPAFHSRAPPA